MDTVIRAFELPLGGLARPNDPDAPDERASLWPLLRECWRHSTDLANWASRYLSAHDPGRRPRDKKLRPYKLPYLYGLAPRLFAGWSFFQGATQTASSILRKVEKKYRQERFAAVWLGDRRTPEFRYPFPWPVHNQAWRNAWIDKGGRMFVEVALPGGTVILRLRGGPEFGRQVAQFRHVCQLFKDWNALPSKERPKVPWAELVIREQPCSTGCHRPGLTEKASGGGQDRPQRVMVKMVARLSKPERTGNRTLTLITDPNAFWVAELDGQPAWVLNNDHWRRTVAKHEAHLSRLQRLSQDAKAERRLGSNEARTIREYTEKLCDEHHKFMASRVHESAAHLIGYAMRQHVGEILYLDRDRGFLPQFPWADLHGKLQDKAEAAGIEFMSESGCQVPTALKDASKNGTGNGEVVIDIQNGSPREDSVCLRVTKLREMAARRLLKARQRKGSHRAVSGP